jgi:hypothetical protein
MRMPSIPVGDSKADSPVAAIGDHVWQEEPCPRRPTRGGEPTVVRPQTRLHDLGPSTTESPRIAIWATRTRSCRIDAGNMAAAPTPGKTARRVAAVCNGGSPANRVLRRELPHINRRKHADYDKATDPACRRRFDRVVNSPDQGKA